VPGFFFSMETEIQILCILGGFVLGAFFLYLFVRFLKSL